MEILAAVDFAATLASITSFLYVAIGLGLVIFFHELGHFAVAKWCDVHVERFSIGFGPIIWSRQKGETEYAVSAIPFGGYVKMLGQDDLDPNQMTDGDLAQNPRAYSSKNVPQRMAIISAGVIMNVITGLLFYAIAFRLGVRTPPPEVGTVLVGSPAWEAGLQHGDRLTHVGGDQIDSFVDLTLAVALSSGDLTVEGIRRDGESFKTTVVPDSSGNRRTIGVGPIRGLDLIVPQEEEYQPTPPGLPGSAAGFEPGDLIVEIGGQPVDGFAGLMDVLAERRAEELEFVVTRRVSIESTEMKPDPVSLTVAARRFRSIGLWMAIGEITSLRQGSPAAKAGFKTGDKIETVDGRKVGTDIDALRLPEYFASRHGDDEPIAVEVRRPDSNGGDTLVALTVEPEDKAGWVERPGTTSAPLSIPAIGVAFHVVPYITKVVEGSPAEKAGIKAHKPVSKIQFVAPKDAAEPDGYSAPTLDIEFNKTPEEGEEVETVNWAHAFWLMQVLPQRTIKIDTGGSKLVEFSPDDRMEIDDWYLPIRGLRPDWASQLQIGETTGEAWRMGVAHTKNTAVQIYLTLRSLVRGDLSPKELRGPIGIATVGYQLAREGISKLLVFLGFLSVNLAVLNFLPIPVLDGGHMVFLIWEGITRRRPSEKVLIAATYVGMIFVLSLMMFVIYLDIFVHWLG